MGVGRYELSDVQWSRIENLLPGRVETVGRTAADNRVFINGVLWVLRSGAHWHDLPERYGKYKSVHKRFSRWSASGVWEKIFRDLVADCFCGRGWEKSSHRPADCEHADLHSG